MVKFSMFLLIILCNFLVRQHHCFCNRTCIRRILLNIVQVDSRSLNEIFRFQHKVNNTAVLTKCSMFQHNFQGENKHFKIVSISMKMTLFPIEQKDPKLSCNSFNVKCYKIPFMVVDEMKSFRN